MPSPQTVARMQREMKPWPKVRDKEGPAGKRLRPWMGPPRSRRSPSLPSTLAYGLWKKPSGRWFRPCGIKAKARIPASLPQRLTPPGEHSRGSWLSEAGNKGYSQAVGCSPCVSARPGSTSREDLISSTVPTTIPAPATAPQPPVSSGQAASLSVRLGA